MRESIDNIIKQGENSKIEFKTSFQKEVCEAIVAFANAKGGVVLIGIDDSANIIGVDVGAETIQNYINTIKQNTQPNLMVDIEQTQIKNKTVLMIDIKEQPIKPISYKNRYYKRVQNSNHLMSLEEISHEHLKTLNESWDYYVDTRHDFSDISQENIITLIEKIEKYQNKKFSDDPLTILKKYELLKDDKLTFGAYLLFTSNFSILTAFQIGRFKSDTKIIDNIDINTNVVTQIDTAIEFIRKHLMIEYIITGNPQREEKYDYPLEAIREIVVNMIVHRDYRDCGNSIIKIYDDRIEFFNPGKLYDDITIEKLNTNNYSSRTRNRAIARLFKEAGIIEQYGSGINRIKNECKIHGVIEPKFEEFVHGFRVILYKEKIEERNQNANDGVNEGVNEGVNSLLNLIQNNPNKKTPYFVKELDTSIKNIERWIKKLKDENKIEYIGSPKTGGYYAKIS